MPETEAPAREHPVAMWLTGHANVLFARYGHPVYLVGSALEATDIRALRDVDIVVIMPDEEFRSRFGGDWLEMMGGFDSPAQARWARECGKQASQIARNYRDLNVDFKIQSASWAASTDHAGKPRLRIDTCESDTEESAPAPPAIDEATRAQEAVAEAHAALCVTLRILSRGLREGGARWLREFQPTATTLVEAIYKELDAALARTAPVPDPRDAVVEAARAFVIELKSPGGGAGGYAYCVPMSLFFVLERALAVLQDAQEKYRAQPDAGGEVSDG